MKAIFLSNAGNVNSPKWCEDFTKVCFDCSKQKQLQKSKMEYGGCINFNLFIVVYKDPKILIDLKCLVSVVQSSAVSIAFLKQWNYIKTFVLHE